MSLTNWIYLIFTILAAEFLLALLFSQWSRRLSEKSKVKGIDIFKGIFERQFLFITLINGIPHGLMVFSALKLAMRIKKHDSSDAEAEEKYNNFFLIGNFLSVLVALGYAWLYGQL
ncbi:MAG: hypothetical protein A2W93_02910 [Bacteroidetes bacterium GWF2_43_63]|nr:MAG: hypothetical protein A2W94_08910 [Bacteroidetes bacterium GWE2_42_42]OFY53616.1 MAG: hypothetical protein A2W93_02910 [Bacteroidetes bacterium GWF2_43_63]HBG71048.1 hypothetical protein [Bacteroidales bacterium]HCB63626.1 hypothetical protein [Bacteroidales bacterium]HCY24375.1 hypothetical protein [Bacteroidales bacterium]